MDCGNVCYSMNSSWDSDVEGTLFPHTYISDTRRTQSCSLCAWLILVWQLATTDPNTSHSEALCHKLRKRHAARLLPFLIWLCKTWKFRSLSALWQHVRFVYIALRGFMSNGALFLSPSPGIKGKETRWDNFLFIMTWLYNNCPWQNSASVFCSPDHLISNYLAPKSYILWISQLLLGLFKGFSSNLVCHILKFVGLVRDRLKKEWSKRGWEILISRS